MDRATDVFVIGGGPAGLATAIAARQSGFEVTVADGERPPIDKPCGEGLMPDGLAALAKLGIEIPPQQSQVFRGIQFVSGGLTVHADFPRDRGLGVRRTVLHRFMIAKAESMGVSLLWRTPVTGLSPEGALVGNNKIRSRWIIGADGGNSLVRRWAGLSQHGRKTRYAFRRHYRIAPWSEYMEVHWGPKCQIYITPVAQDEICVALVSLDFRLRLDAALTFFPEIASRLRDAGPSSRERGAVSTTRKLRQVYSGNVALVGDASGTVDSITGEGLCLAFRHAEILASCLVKGNLHDYQQAHLRLARLPAMMARLLLALDWNDAVRQRIMRALTSDPLLFSRMVAMHVGDLSLPRAALNGACLGWRTLCDARIPASSP